MLRTYSVTIVTYQGHPSRAEATANAWCSHSASAEQIPLLIFRSCAPSFPGADMLKWMSRVSALRLLSVTLGLFTATCSTAQVQNAAATSTGFLSTGLRLDPVGEAI